jgi:hypothetical protein
MEEGGQFPESQHLFRLHQTHRFQPEKYSILKQKIIEKAVSLN